MYYIIIIFTNKYTAIPLHYRKLFSLPFHALLLKTKRFHKKYKNAEVISPQLGSLA